VRAAVEGRDVFVLQPTGAGKSICFQLPALMAPPGAVTVVVSPLIALIDNQVDALKRKGIKATAFNSTQTDANVRGVGVSNYLCAFFAYFMCMSTAFCCFIFFLIC